jgi:hypothetical protein
MKRMLPLIVLASGVFAGALDCGCQHEPSGIPVKTSFCFLVHDRELFAHRQFLTEAHMIVDLHGELLMDPACPDSVLSFTSSAPADANSNELDAELRNELTDRLYADVSVTFVGTLNSPSSVERASIWLRRKFGLQVERPIGLTIRQVVSVEKATGIP